MAERPRETYLLVLCVGASPSPHSMVTTAAQGVLSIGAVIGGAAYVYEQYTLTADMLFERNLELLNKHVPDEKLRNAIISDMAKEHLRNIRAKLAAAQDAVDAVRNNGVAEDRVC